MKKPTLEMLAKMAGVGVATVDRVLNERGGVSPEKAQKVLLAAQSLGLKRVLPDVYQHPWQIEVILSANISHFFQTMAGEFSQLADTLGYRRITLHRTFFPENQPEKLAEHLYQCCDKRDGIVVFAQDYPVIYEALEHCKAQGVPVITIVTDLPDAARLCHVGINQLQAGRTAGLMMSKMLNQPGEVIMVSGSFDYRAHRQRIEGFHDVMQQRAAHIILREVLLGLDDRAIIGSLLEQSLQRSKNVVGIYNTGLGNSEIGKVLDNYNLSGKCTFITYELYSVTRSQLQNNILSLTLDQNARQHAQLATELLLRHLESGLIPDTYREGKVDFRLVTPENAD
ncbi:transcriptional regulator [Rouxiella silvae]|uniref:Transcriptional regulator n=1 Tax=Rouxiella silvae TaxID=1646373 RepID=A0AA41BWU1_9GAMM|nr:LacI family DNA-binding transcriptional regulator [Rouxiella silvae]KQN52246.1 transcriptional regulator [Serratia sp. Leaf50]MBF6637362.1 LacI family DNA-binding transcriptional regulator [Rouxiella silvae]ORJ19377.1 transcriptional regulator [Rouxiella silvae]